MKIKQLEELVLGNLSCYAEEPLAKTRKIYENIFKGMGQLRGLEMRQLSLKEVSLSNQ